MHVRDASTDSELITPIVLTAAQGWFDVDLTPYNVIVDGDFYIYYIQLDDYPNCPSIGTDTTSTPVGRSYAVISPDPTFNPVDESSYGILMIRAVVEPFQVSETGAGRGMVAFMAASLLLILMVRRVHP